MSWPFNLGCVECTTHGQGSSDRHCLHERAKQKAREPAFREHCIKVLQRVSGVKIVVISTTPGTKQNRISTPDYLNRIDRAWARAGVATSGADRDILRSMRGHLVSLGWPWCRVLCPEHDTALEAVISICQTVQRGTWQQQHATSIKVTELSTGRGSYKGGRVPMQLPGDSEQRLGDLGQPALQ